MQTSHLKTSDSAFTLIEIMVMLGLLALLVSVALPKIGDNSSEVRSSLRYIISLSKKLKSVAKLHHTSYRLVFDLKNEDRSEQVQEYWIERSNQKTIGELFQKKTETNENSQNESLFIKDTSMFKKNKSLPSGLKVNFIEYVSEKKKVESGKAYLYFLPQGYTQEALIELSYKGQKFWTIYIHPLTGHSFFFEGKKTLKEIKQR